MQFDEAVQYLLGLGHETLTMKLGLRNTELLLRSFNNPETSFQSVQIAGTNGKGSVAIVLDAICRSAGIRTGLYTSPHLTSITERISIDGVNISQQMFAEDASAVRDAAHALLRREQIEALPTFFEQLTVIALLAFRNAGVELSILETGLGGRLDSTTAARAGLVGITPIDFDHEEYLGNTLAQIASEKAAIIRPGVSAVIGAQAAEAWAVILDQCESTGVKPIHDEVRIHIEDVSADGAFCVTYRTSGELYKKLWLGLRGRHQVENTAIAIQLAESLRTMGYSIPHQAIAKGVAVARHPGRLELIDSQPRMLLDGAHNAAGARVLREYLERFSTRPLTLIFGCMRDKRLEEMASTLFPAVDRLILTPVENARTASIERLERIARDLLPTDRISVSRTSHEALAQARIETPREGLICVAGSLYLVGELRSTIIENQEMPAA